MLISDLLTAFHQGKELTNAATWKNRTVAINCLTAFLAAAFAIAKGFGYDLDLDPNTAQTLAEGVLAAVGVANSVVHVVTSQKIGLPPRAASDPEPPESAG